MCHNHDLVVVQKYILHSFITFFAKSWPGTAFIVMCSATIVSVTYTLQLSGTVLDFKQHLREMKTSTGFSLLKETYNLHAQRNESNLPTYTSYFKTCVKFVVSSYNLADNCYE